MGELEEKLAGAGLAMAVAGQPSNPYNITRISRLVQMYTGSRYKH